jgi:hypothetical protein
VLKIIEALAVGSAALAILKIAVHVTEPRTGSSINALAPLLV